MNLEIFSKQNFFNFRRKSSQARNLEMNLFCQIFDGRQNWIFCYANVNFAPLSQNYSKLTEFPKISKNSIFDNIPLCKNERLLN